MKKHWISPALTLLLALALCVPALAAAEGEIGRVIDTAELLNYEEWERLETQAERITGRYDCGVYIVTVDDYEEYGSGSVYDVTTQIYNNRDNGFGVGSERDGIILLLSMDHRDYALFVHGENAEYAFNSYGQKQLEEEFLDDFKDDDWYSGFSDYLETCGEYLARAEDGDPVHQGPTIYILCSIGVSLFIAFIVCMIGKGKMNTVHQKVEASAYAAGSLRLTDQRDQFTHTTETRRKIEKESRSERGGGGSGRSGKF